MTKTSLYHVYLQAFLKHQCFFLLTFSVNLIRVLQYHLSKADTIGTIDNFRSIKLSTLGQVKLIDILAGPSRMSEKLLHQPILFTSRRTF